MSRLSDLIKGLYPADVPSVSLGSLMTRIRERGKDDESVAQVYVVSNTQGMVRAEDYRENTIHSEDTSNYTVIRPGMIAYNPSRLNIGSIAMLKNDEPGLVSPMYVVFSIDQSKVEKEYVELILKSPYVSSRIEVLKEEGARFRFDYTRWDWINVPLPSKTIQHEVVNTLNVFQDLINGLTSELDARKKQYEYYSGALLSNGTDAPMKRLGDTCRMKSGKSIKSVMISAVKDAEHPYPCFGGNDVRGYIAEPSHRGDYPIIGRQGALCGNVNYATGTFYATEHAVVVESLGEYEQRYLFYLLTAMNLNQYKSQGAQPGLAVGNIENLVASVPSLEQQRKVIEILDRFDALCNDISIGLPAEIAARHKQYEYYRDNLLTFKELS